jgi:hypothetical protein
MATCANPACDKEIVVAGVCVKCANSPYSVSEHGVEYAGIATGDGYER